MKKGIITLLVVGIFLFSIFLHLFLVGGFTLTFFNNSLTDENLTFIGNQNITRYLEINRYANVTSAAVNLSGTNQDDIETDEEDWYTDYGKGLSASVDENFGTYNCKKVASGGLAYSFAIDENMSIKNNYSSSSINWTSRGLYKYTDSTHYAYNVLYYYKFSSVKELLKKVRVNPPTKNK